MPSFHLRRIQIQSHMAHTLFGAVKKQMIRIWIRQFAARFNHIAIGITGARRVDQLIEQGLFLGTHGVGIR